MVRSEDDIKREYIDLCTRSGELQYQIQQMQGALVEINNRILSVNKEFVELKKSQESKSQEEVDVQSQAQTD